MFMTPLQSWLGSNFRFAEIPPSILSKWPQPASPKPQVHAPQTPAKPKEKLPPPQVYDIFQGPTILGYADYARPLLILSIKDGGQSVYVAPISSKWGLYDRRRFDVPLRTWMPGYNETGLDEDSFIVNDTSYYKTIPVDTLVRRRGRLTGDLLSSFLEATGLTASSRWVRTVCAFTAARPSPTCRPTPETA